MNTDRIEPGALDGDDDGLPIRAEVTPGLLMERMARCDDQIADMVNGLVEKYRDLAKKKGAWCSHRDRVMAMHATGEASKAEWRARSLAMRTLVDPKDPDCGTYGENLYREYLDADAEVKGAEATLAALHDRSISLMSLLKQVGEAYS